jgi:hypothetical protein
MGAAYFMGRGAGDSLHGYIIHTLEVHGPELPQVLALSRGAYGTRCTLPWCDSVPKGRRWLAHDDGQWPV